MRLINARTLEMEEFFGRSVPQYAILSHTWGAEEVSYQEWETRDLIRHKSGYSKIVGACEMALRRGLGFVWVDTNCIDKKSSAELSEAINSMFEWYMNSAVCLVYLSDVDGASSGQEQMSQFRRSRWFTRGWTLQELLAPSTLQFYDSGWGIFAGGADRQDLGPVISDVTGIKLQHLIDPVNTMHSASVAERMSWMATRTTTRVEDAAYCMLGIFDINMPLLYGEGPRSFFRLQEEIIKTSPDQTIFCWDNWMRCYSVLAPSPAAFRGGAKYSTRRRDGRSTPHYTITNVGIAIELPVVHHAGSALVAVLDVAMERAVNEGARGQEVVVCLPLAKSPNGNYYRNAKADIYPIPYIPQLHSRYMSLTLLHRMSRPSLREFASSVEPPGLLAGTIPAADASNGINIVFSHPVRVSWHIPLENSRFRLGAGRLEFPDPAAPPGGILLGVLCEELRSCFGFLIANAGRNPAEPSWAVGSWLVEEDGENMEQFQRLLTSGHGRDGSVEFMGVGRQLHHDLEQGPNLDESPLRAQMLKKDDDRNPYMIHLELAGHGMGLWLPYRSQDILLSDPCPLPSSWRSAAGFGSLMRGGFP